jgi:hypothetical protein
MGSQQKAKYLTTIAPANIIKSVSEIRAAFASAPNLHIHEFENKGHFCSDDMGTTFPEILRIIK